MSAILVRLLTLNIFLRPFLISSYWQGEYKEQRMEDFVNLYSGKYDVICMQEVFGSWSWRRERLIEMFHEKGFEYYAHMSDAPRNQLHCSKLGCFKNESPYLSTDSGVLVVSRFPIDMDRMHELIYSKKEWSDSMARKGVLHVPLKLSEKVELDVFTTHLQSGSKNSSQEIRNTQLRELSQFIQEYNSPGVAAVVAGDFNMNAINKTEYELLISGLESHLKGRRVNNVLSDIQQRTPTSYGHTNIFEQERTKSAEHIDYLFLLNNGRTNVESAAVQIFKVFEQPYVRISDHDGVAARLMLG